MNLEDLNLKKHKHWFYLWLIALLMVALGKIYEIYYPEFKHDKGHQFLKNCQQKINQVEAGSKELEAQIKGIYYSNQNKDEFIAEISKRLSNHSLFSKFSILFCENEKLIYWNRDNVRFDPKWCPCLENEGSGIFDFENSYYFGINKTLNSEKFGLCYIIYSELSPNDINGREFHISEERNSKESLSLKNERGQNIAFISNIGSNLSSEFSNFILIFYLLLLIIFYYPTHYFGKIFFNMGMNSWGFLTLLIGIIATSSLANWLVSNPDYFDSIFTSSKFKTNYFQYTLFELIVLSILVFHIAYFFHKYYILKVNQPAGKNYVDLIIPLFNYAITFLALLVYCNLFKTVFVKSEFSFNLDKSIFLPLENYLLLISLLLILISVFLIAHKLCLSTISYQLPIKRRIQLFTIAFAITIPLLYKLNLEITLISFFLSSSIIIWLLDYFVDYKQTSALWLISWILIISFLTSGLIFHYQNIRKRYEKIALLNSITTIGYSKLDSNTTSISSDVGILIEKSNQLGYDLFIYENETPRYSSNFKKPELIQLKNDLGTKSKTIVVRNSEEWLVQKIKPNYLILISHPIPSIVKAISLFSYLFTILIILSYLVSLVHQKYPILPDGLNIQVDDKPSLRTKIQFYIILGIVFSFLIIALVTVFFTKRSEQQITEETLYNKIKYLSTFLEQSISSTNNLQDAQFVLTEQIKSTSSLFDYGVEFYDNRGFEVNLYKNQSSTNTKIKLCNPSFYFYYPFGISDIVIKVNDDFNNQIKISGFKNIFLNNLRLGTLEMVSYINNEKARDNRLNNLINTLLNIYVFLFLIAASLATILANSITSPLEVLSDKLKSMRLGKRNETLDWSGQDEIGELIQDYNRMVTQLDESAGLLAKSERDSAWREMAKQVAHEIKNPLTPMKLNIQYLQQKIKSGEKDLTELIQRISVTLLEQIDGLTQIATEFSNFAKMPKAENEKILINDLVSSVHDLFRKREDVDIYLIVPIDELFVFCDKNQMIRVLNNLINNSIQAIPEHRKGKIDIQLGQKNNFAFISIKDNGVGIDAEMKEKVFLPNFTTKNSGTGLGLAMCRQIIESVNGKIYFISEINVGTEFIVELPLMRLEKNTN